jgi:hypothetical protein
MRLPAQKRLELQAAYPSQAEGGVTGDLHKSLRQALVRWEQKRGITVGIKFRPGNRSMMPEKRSATRSEISWNAAPEVKRAPCPAKRKIRDEAEREENRRRMKERREAETPEQREKRLQERRDWYLKRQGGVLKIRSKQTPEERKQSVKDAKMRYQERLKAGLVAKTVRPPSKLTEKQLQAKRERQKKYYERSKHSTISAS